MDPEEAIYSLEAVGHDFYVYRDKASNELRVSRGGRAAEVVVSQGWGRQCGAAVSVMCGFCMFRDKASNKELS
jgi:hypothetical protein